MVDLYSPESRKVAVCLLQGTIQDNDYEIPYFIRDNSYLGVDGRLALPTSTPSLRALRPLLTLASASAASVMMSACGGNGGILQTGSSDTALVAQSTEIFRFDTFGDGTPWTDSLRLHEAISKAVSPVAALAVGLKVDSEALPSAVVQGT